MADLTTAPVLSVCTTVGSKLADMPVTDGQLIFVRDKRKVALDFDGKRTVYSQIEELSTEAARTAMLAPVSGLYYFVLETGVLWTYRDAWIQITTAPETISPAIIDVTALPTDNINENAFYRLLTGTFVYNQFSQNAWTCHSVDTLPEGGEPVTLDMVNITAYYDVSTNDAYGYLNDALASQAGVPTGWYTLATLAPIFGVSWSGIITDILDDPKDDSIRLLLEYVNYSYKSGKWTSQKVIGWAGTGASAEVFNHPSNKATGNSSHAEGNSSHAEGHYSHAEGNSSHAEGHYSHAEGHSSHAEGNSSHAEGDSSHAEGYYSHAEGYYSHAKGHYSHAEGHSSHAEGYYSHAEGNSSHAEGNSSHAEGHYSHAEGNSSHAEGHYSHAEGNSSHAEGDSSHAEGYYSHAEGDSSHAEGHSSHAEGHYSHAEGHSSHAEGYYSHAEGYYSHAEGHYSHAEGYYSHAEGYGAIVQKIISGSANTASYTVNDVSNLIIGSSIRYTISNGNYTTAKILAIDTVNKTITVNRTLSADTALSNVYVNIYISGMALSDNTHSEGNQTIAAGRSQHTQGEFNVVDPEYDVNDNSKRGKYAHIVGNGTSRAARSNAHTLDWDGNGWFAGDVYVGGTGQDDESAKKVLTEGAITDPTISLSDGVLKVNTTNVAEQDNTLPITSAGVYTQLGNIEALLLTI